MPVLLQRNNGGFQYRHCPLLPPLCARLPAVNDECACRWPRRHVKMLTKAILLIEARRGNRARGEPDGREMLVVELHLDLGVAFRFHQQPDIGRRQCRRPDAPGRFDNMSISRLSAK